MHPQIAKVLYHIETHLDEVYDLNTLAEVAGYSTYHFCRVFKAEVGESVISYSTKLRLQRASLAVLNSERSILEVALEAGYETPNGFYKAFKKIFGVTPTEYKDQCIALRHDYKESSMQGPSVIYREAVTTVSMTRMGAYEQSAPEAWNSLFSILKAHKEAQTLTYDVHSSELIGICYDDPANTPPEAIRYDAAIQWSDEQSIPRLVDEGLKVLSIPAGRYACVQYQGGYENAVKAWGLIYGWISEQGLTCRDFPPFEKYLESHKEVEEKDHLTEIYVPVM